MKPYRHQRGDVVAGWRLLKRLGSGGNGTVWRATREGKHNVALKILRRASGGAYVRFQSEVELLSRLRDNLGILPILEHDLPDNPSPDSPPWFSMPIATTLREALGTRAPFDATLRAIRDVAKTLAELHALEISHRDIKPDNLFWYAGRAVIGDWGLGKYSEKKALTVPDRKLGPLYFIATEMLDRANTADGSRADVYSLAKTLHVLVSGQNYPPQGPQRVGDNAVSLTRAVTDPRAATLDFLMERATSNDPNARGSASDFARELDAILTGPRVSDDPLDLSHLQQRVRELMEPRERFARDIKRRSDALAMLRTQASAFLRELVPAYRSAGFRGDMHSGGDLFKSACDEAYERVDEASVVVCPAGLGSQIDSGVVMFAYKDDTIAVVGGHVELQTEHGQGMGRPILPLTRRREALGSAALERALEDVCTATMATTRAALTAFLANHVTDTVGQPVPVVQAPRWNDGLTETASRIVEHFIATSTDGAYQPFLKPEDVTRIFGAAVDDIREAIQQLEDRGWVQRRAAFNPLRLGDVSPRPRLFIDLDKHFRDWDPRADARLVAQEIKQKGRVRIEDLARQLGWSPRRINPALAVLEDAEAYLPSSERSPPFLRDSVRKNARTGLFLRGE